VQGCEFLPRVRYNRLHLHPGVRVIRAQKGNQRRTEATTDVSAFVQDNTSNMDIWFSGVTPDIARISCEYHFPGDKKPNMVWSVLRQQSYDVCILHHK